MGGARQSRSPDNQRALTTMGMRVNRENRRPIDVKPGVGTEGSYTLCVGFLLVLVSLGFLLSGNVYG